MRLPTPSRVTVRLCRTRHAAAEEATADVAEFLSIAAIRGLSITAEEAITALVAFARYAKGRGHPTQLNLGDCFVYAAARNRRIPMLCRSSDFARTDIDSPA